MRVELREARARTLSRSLSLSLYGYAKKKKTFESTVVCMRGGGGKVVAVEGRFPQCSPYRVHEPFLVTLLRRFHPPISLLALERIGEGRHVGGQ